MKISTNQTSYKTTMNYVKHFNSSIGDGNKSSEIIKMIAGYIGDDFILGPRYIGDDF
jgi:hypothetical protein